MRHGARRYRCRANDDYALDGHPRQLYVGEAIIVRALEGWIAQLFDPDRIDETVEPIVAACSDATRNR